MAEPRVSTCSPWATIDDFCPPCLDVDDLPDEMLDRMLQIASDLLFEATARRFPGTCTTTVRPCSQRIYHDPMRRYDGSWTFDCGCSGPSSCGCPRPSEITLGVEPIVEITEVVVNGEILTPDLYRVDDYRTLVRLRDPDGSYQSWLCCQDILLPDTEDNTFSVTFTYGTSPPPAGVLAAAVLACELAIQCGVVSGEGIECRLPRRVVSLTRQGVSMILQDPTQTLFQKRWGIPEIDQFVALYNPYALTRQASVLSPDYPQRVRHIDTAAETGS